jgi:hypothetical protein
VLTLLYYLLCYTLGITTTVPTHLDMVDSSTVTMVTAGVKEKGKKRSKSQKRADLLSVSPDAQDAKAPAHKAAKVSKDTAKGKKQKKSKERADASDQAPTSKKSKKISFNSAAADSDIVHFFTDFEEVMATRAPYTMYEEMLSRLSEQAVASSVREYTKQEVADINRTDRLRLCLETNILIKGKLRDKAL